tara:strand:- start:1253 stop:1798 length:546 start_codon:yes stop_codon:yes gene_type:complete
MDNTLQDHSELLRQIRKRAAISRSTYSPTNAQRVKPIIDKLLEGQNDVLITAKETGYTVGTLHVKLTDGFKFLVDNSVEYGPIYGELRTQVALRKTETGVLIYFKDTIRNRMKAEALNYQHTDPSVWRSELLTWLQSAKEMDKFEREKLIINSEDIEWLKEQQKLTEFEFSTENDSLVVIR